MIVVGVCGGVGVAGGWLCVAVLVAGDQGFIVKIIHY